MNENLLLKLQQITNDFLADKFISLTKNLESSDGNVYVILAQKNKYFVKIYEDKRHALSMLKVYEKLTDSGVNVPKVLYHNVDEKSAEQNGYILIYSFVTGFSIDKVLTHGKVKADLIIKIAKEVRKMHDCGTDENHFFLNELKFDTVNQRKTLLHFDLTKSNIFLNSANEIFIIDFDDAVYGSAIYDIAILISTFFFSKKRGVDLDGMNLFIDSYYGEDESLKATEKRLIGKCATQWIDYLFAENKISDSLKESFSAKKTLIKKYFT